MDLDHPDYDTYPGSRLLQPVDVVMGPGDVMMFPRCSEQTAHVAVPVLYGAHHGCLSLRHAASLLVVPAGKDPASCATLLLSVLKYGMILGAAGLLSIAIRPWSLRHAS